jgi:phytoene dehydrogenase-like protein
MLSASVSLHTEGVMGEKTVAIIGAGMGGLAAGCYAQLSGLKAHVFEAHNLPGGLCTSWKRTGYTFDGCIHHLAGCHPDGPVYRMWEELGVMPRQCIFPDRLTQVESPDGRVFSVYTDIDRLEEHMLAAFPHDRVEIRKYTRAARAFRNYDLLEASARSRVGLLRYLSAFPLILRWAGPSMEEVGTRFRDPFLRKAFPTIQYDWPDIPAMIHLNMLAQCSRRNYGFPIGGSLPFSQAIERRFRELGGKISYQTRVTRILTQEGRAVGVRLADGNEIRVDGVISDAYAPATLFELLDEEALDARTRARFAIPEDEIVMGLQISLGVARELVGEPQALVLFQEEPVQLADHVLDRVPVELYGFDPTLAPAGKSVIRVALTTSYAYWERLAEDRARYLEAKDRAARTVIDVLEPRFPGIRGQVDVVDVATPLTTARFTGNAKPYAHESGKADMLALLLSKPWTLSRIRNLQIIGQSAGGGGLNGCASMGRNAVRALCKALGTRSAH